ncbi:hypothetical protein OAP83_02320 [Rickettsiales bacterium]|nr:hypothetical protein [Rickettsiales bacterium]
MNFQELELEFIRHSEGFLKEFIKNCEKRRFEGLKPSDKIIDSKSFFASPFQFEQFDYFARANKFFITNSPSSQELVLPFANNGREDTKNVERLIKLNHRVVFLIRKFQQYLPEDHDLDTVLELSNVSNPTSTADYYQNYDKFFNVLFDQIKDQLKTVLSFDEYVQEQKLYLPKGKFENEARFYQKYRLLQGCLTKLVKQNCDFSVDFLASSQIANDQKLLFEKKPNDNIRIDTHIEQFLNWQSSKLEQASKQEGFRYVDPFAVPSPAFAALSQMNLELRSRLEEAQTSSAAERKQFTQQYEELQKQLAELKRLETSGAAERERLEQAQTSGAAAIQAQQKDLDERQSKLTERERVLEQAQTSGAAANHALQQKLNRQSEVLKQAQRELAEKQRQRELESLRRTASPRHNGIRGSFNRDLSGGNELYYREDEGDSANTLPASHTAYDYSDSVIGGRSEEMNSSEDDTVPRYEEYGHQHDVRQALEEGRTRLELRHQRELESMLAEAKTITAEEIRKLSEGHKEEQKKIKQELAAKLAAVETSKSDSESKFTGEIRKLRDEHEKALRELEEKFAEELAKAAATPSTPSRGSTAASPSTTKPGSPTGVADFDSDKDNLLRSLIPSEMKRLNKSSNNQAFDDFISLCKQDGEDGNESFQVIFKTIQANKSAYIDFANKLLTRLALMGDTEVKKAFQLIKQFSDKDQKHDMWCQLFDDLSDRADYDDIIKQNRAAFIEFANLSVAMKDTTDAVECFNAIDNQKIQDSISRKIGVHSDLFAINDGQGPAYQSIRQQSSIGADDQVPLLPHKGGYQPDYYDMTKTSLGGGLALGGLVAAGTTPAFFLGALVSGAVIALPLSAFIIGAIGSGVYTKLHNNEETKKYNKEGNPVNYQSQISSTDIVR